MKKILCIDTGGTFNKIYNPITGLLEIESHSEALKEIIMKWQKDFEIISIVGKDSLELTDKDRLFLLATINLSSHQDIIIIHGTDTMDITAAYLANSQLERQIILTGAMVPYSIDPVEATANFSAACGYLQALEKDGIYISMNGIVMPCEDITKDRETGKFIVKV